MIRNFVRVHQNADQASGQAFFPWQVGAIYDYPLDKGFGKGSHIVLVEFGGGVLEEEIFAFIRQRYPQINPLPVQYSNLGGMSAVFNATDDACIECTLDLTVALAIAPAAQVTMIYAPNEQPYFVTALQRALALNPTVISISWGMAEEFWDPNTIHQLEVVLTEIAGHGIPVLVSAGDQGAFDTTKAPAINYPASSPNAIACGGTSLLANPATGAFTQKVWDDNSLTNATGGGISEVFTKPAFQSTVNIPGLPPKYPTNTRRGIPDISANADPETGYILPYAGKQIVVGGTSAVAPLYAGYFALLKSIYPAWNMADLLSTMYTNQQAFLGVTQGSNGWWTAHPGWNACCGLGTLTYDNIAKIGGKP